MKLLLLSDIHQESRKFEEWKPLPLDTDGVDVVVLAGDIGAHTRGIEWAARTFRPGFAGPEVIYLAGNHEFYGANFGGLLLQMRQRAADLGIHFLDRDAVEIDGVRFLGATLWSNFTLYGGGEHALHYAKQAERSINDFRMIRGGGGHLFSARDCAQEYLRSRRFLNTELAKDFAGKTVVVTHFSPHKECIAPQFVGDALTPYFTSDMSDLMEKYRPALWLYGHTHHSCHFIAEGGTRVVSNQIGYWMDEATGLPPSECILTV